MKPIARNIRPGAVRLVAGCAALLSVAALVWLTHGLVSPPPLGAERAAFRDQNLAEVREADVRALTTPGWVDRARGIVRLPIEEALKLAEREWQNPTQARAHLLGRLEKATAVPAKPAGKPGASE